MADLASLWQSSKFNSNGKGLKQESSIDPAIVGSMIDLFSTLNKVSNDAENNNVDENNNDKHAEPKSHEEPSMDWDAILSFAGEPQLEFNNFFIFIFFPISVIYLLFVFQ